MADKLIRDRSTPENSNWWDAVLRAAEEAPVLKVRKDVPGYIDGQNEERARVLELMAVAKVEHDGLRPFTAFKELENAIRSGETAAELEKRLRGE